MDFSSEPYYDDYSESSKFYKILFRPGYAVQTRELNQIQSIIQKQISSHGNNIFKHGAMVVPGQISYDNNVDSIKLEVFNDSIYVNTYIDSLMGSTISNELGLTALVVATYAGDVTNPPTIFVKYTNSSTDGLSKTFADNQILTTSDSAYSVTTQFSDAISKGSIASIEKGVYYINGTFVLNDAQTIILDLYSVTPSYNVGFTIVETITTPDSDETLLDNAFGSYNYSAPGAHRHYINLVLSKLALTETENKNFVELLRVEDGVNKKFVQTTAYNILEKTLARRTYDESGNYTVKEFNIDVREHRNNDQGTWAAGKTYRYGDIVVNGLNTYVCKNLVPTISLATVPPVHTGTTPIHDGSGSAGALWDYNLNPTYNRGIYTEGDESKLAVGIEPGKAYVNGYEIEKIATDFIAIDKSRSSDLATDVLIDSTVGTFTYITNILNLPPVDNLGVVQLYNSKLYSNDVPSGPMLYLVGTARIRLMEWDSGTVGSSSSIYKASLFDIEILPGYTFNDNVKSFYYFRSDGSSFVANISSLLTLNSGLIKSSGTTITSLTNTNFLSEVSLGDYISVDGTEYRITSVPTASSFTVNSAPSPVLTSSSYSIVKTSVNELSSDSMIFSLPLSNVKSVRNIFDSFNILYTSYIKMTGVLSGGSTILVVSSGSIIGSLISGENNSNYIVTRNDTGAVVTPSNIVVLGNQVTISFATSLSVSNVSCSVIGAIQRTGSATTEKIKTLSLYTKTITDKVTATSQIISLTKPDCYNIKSIKMKSGTFAAPTGTYSIDISDRYTFDNGQRYSHYQSGSITLNSGFLPPIAPIEIVVEYFEHSAGDFSTVNSYSTAIPYESIDPLLRDSIDFRPLITDGIVSSTTVSIPKRGYGITLDYSYYLSIKERIGVDITGSLFSVLGAPALSPAMPEDPATGMILYNLTLAPYTYDSSVDSVTIEKIDNKRYTMRDIGKLEKRIDNIEYYTSLSLLEVDTQTFKITDPLTGLDRFKNGFIVDNFSGHGVGNVNSVDYQCSIDMENNQLRPATVLKNINLIEEASTDIARLSIGHYGLYGSVITLPIIDHIPLVSQRFASRLENINPFAIFTFIGNVSLNPSSDDWFETNRLPDVVTNVEGNYAAMSKTANKKNALGTVWNSWQNVWTGTLTATNKSHLNQFNTSISKLNKLGGFFHSSVLGGNWTVRQMTVQNYAQNVGQSRTGINTKLVTSIDRVTVADKTVSTAVIPYIRSRNILVQVRGLKPSTIFYPYFDDTTVSAYCTPAQIMTYTSLTTKDFDSEVNAGSLADSSPRYISNDSQVCLNKGDVIYNAAGTSTAVVAGVYLHIPDGITEVRTLHLINIKGSFYAGDVIHNVDSSARGTVVSFVNVANPLGTQLKTNASGDLNLLFKVPNTDAIRFRTGTREFKLMDSPTALGSFTSRGRTQYEATGILETKQASVNAVRNANLVQSVVNETRTIVQTTQRVLSDTGWYDPLAQSFLVDNKGGAFLTKVDVFFATKDKTLPVTLQIRNMVNGYPGNKILPFSTVILSPNKIKLSSSTVMYDNFAYPKYDTPTTFAFESPVYVEDATEYCIVLLSDSNNYKCWISQLGDSIPGTSNVISSQPYNGVLFKSQNASTWTADQMQDLKFTIYKAKFDISTSANSTFVNDKIPFTTLEKDPIQLTAGKTIARVWHSNHGLSEGDIVSMSGVPTIAGIAAANFNTTHTISSVDLESYVITGIGTSLYTGYYGGSAVVVNENIIYDVIQPSTQIQSFPETDVNYSIITDYNGTTANEVNVIANDNNYFSMPHTVYSEYDNTVSKSLAMNVRMTSTNDSLSPVLDTHRMSAIAINNTINNPLYDVSKITDADYTASFTGATGAFSFSKNLVTAGAFVIGTTYTIVTAGTTNYTLIGATNNTIGTKFVAKGIGSGTGTAAADSLISSSVVAVIDNMANILPGQYIKVTGATSNNGVYLVTNVSIGATGVLTVVNTTTGNLLAVESAVTATTVSVINLFSDEMIANGSSSAAKYVSNPIKLALPSTSVSIKFSANVPTDANIDVYYKTTLGSAVSIDTIKYSIITPSADIVKVQNGDETFYDVDYLVTTGTFDTVQIKLVMNSNNTSAVPKIKDLRIIALQ